MCMCVHVCVIPVNWRKLTATSAYVQDDSLLFLLPPVLGPDSPPSPTFSSAFNLHCSSTSRQIQPPFSLTSSLCGLHHILGNDTTLPPSSPVLSLKGICSAANQLCLSEKLSVEPKLLPSFPISTVPGGLKSNRNLFQTRGLQNSRHLLSHSSGGWNSKINVSAGPRTSAPLKAPGETHSLLLPASGDNCRSLVHSFITPNSASVIPCGWPCTSVSSCSILLCVCVCV